MEIVKDLIPLLAVATSVVSISFLSKKDKINRMDSIVEKSIKIKQETDDIILQIFDLLINENSKIDELKQKIKEFWKKIDEIGFLHSRATLVDKEIMQVFFNSFYGKIQSRNLLENIFIIMMYGSNAEDNIKNFALNELNIKDTQQIKNLDDIDTEVLGEFVKKHYPYIWSFVWHRYEKNRFKRIYKKLKNTCLACYNGITEVCREMLKPILSALIVYGFLLALPTIKIATRHTINYAIAKAIIFYSKISPKP